MHEFGTTTGIGPYELVMVGTQALLGGVVVFPAALAVCFWRGGGQLESVPLSEETPVKFAIEPVSLTGGAVVLLAGVFLVQRARSQRPVRSGLSIGERCLIATLAPGIAFWALLLFAATTDRRTLVPTLPIATTVAASMVFVLLFRRRALKAALVGLAGGVGGTLIGALLGVLPILVAVAVINSHQFSEVEAKAVLGLAMAPAMAFALIAQFLALRGLTALTALV